MRVVALNVLASFGWVPHLRLKPAHQASLSMRSLAVLLLLAVAFASTIGTGEHLLPFVPVPGHEPRPIIPRERV